MFKNTQKMEDDVNKEKRELTIELRDKLLYSLNLNHNIRFNFKSIIKSKINFLFDLYLNDKIQYNGSGYEETISRTYLFKLIEKNFLSINITKTECMNKKPFSIYKDKNLTIENIMTELKKIIDYQDKNTMLKENFRNLKYKSIIKFDSGDFLKCFNCGYHFFVDKKVICPLCDNIQSFTGRYYDPNNYKKLRDMNKLVVERYIAGKKGQIYHINIKNVPDIYIIEKQNGYILMINGFEHNFENIHKLKNKILNDLIHPYKNDIFNKHQYDKIISSIKLDLVMGFIMIKLSPKLKGRILYLEQNKIITEINKKTILNRINTIQKEYDNLTNLKEEINNFVSNTLLKIKSEFDNN